MSDLRTAIMSLVLRAEERREGAVDTDALRAALAQPEQPEQGCNDCEHRDRSELVGPCADCIPHFPALPMFTTAQPDKATEASGSNDNSGAVGSQVDRGVRPPVADKYAKAVLHADGSLHNFTLRIGGTLYQCDCGCNVFHKPDRKRLDLYECNGCGSRLEASI